MQYICIRRHVVLHALSRPSKQSIDACGNIRGDAVESGLGISPTHSTTEVRNSAQLLVPSVTRRGDRRRWETVGDAKTCHADNPGREPKRGRPIDAGDRPRGHCMALSCVVSMLLWWFGGPGGGGGYKSGIGPFWGYFERDTFLLLGADLNTRTTPPLHLSRSKHHP